MPRGRGKKERRNFYAEVISAPEAAALLKISERTFNRLVESGVIPKDDYGEYILGEVIEAYWHYQLDSEGLLAAKTRLTTAMAELRENELAEQRGDLHRASAVVKVWTDNVMNAKTRLLSIPSKIGPELVGKDLLEIQAKLKSAIYEALEELAEYDGKRITSTAALMRQQ